MSAPNLPAGHRLVQRSNGEITVVLQADGNGCARFGPLVIVPDAKPPPLSEHERKELERKRREFVRCVATFDRLGLTELARGAAVQLIAIERVIAGGPPPIKRDWADVLLEAKQAKQSDPP